MANTAVQLREVGKQFHIGGRQARYKTLRESLGDVFLAPMRRAANLLRGHAAAAADLSTSFWALRDVSFDVMQGEVVGVIGRNGAGKSTLLKILSRITEPTKGYCEIRGRVGSLLEVGTGFHNELTGRENIYLNGSILGMTRAEINRKFDEIVDFSEIEQFLDTPIKHYSSGMQMRLAFAVAAHLEPEILIIDEVLAVGDAAFQKKCLSKMEDVGKEGRTVLFVSHNMPAVTRLCKRCVLLNEGSVIADGPAHKVVSTYLTEGAGTTAAREWQDAARAPGGEIGRLQAVRIKDTDETVTDAADIRKPVILEMEYSILEEGYVLLPHFRLFNEEGVNVFETLDQDPQWRGRPRPAGRYVSRATIPGNFLAEGTLFVSCHLITLNPVRVVFSESQTVAFQVVDQAGVDTARGDWTGEMSGAVRPLLSWETRYQPLAKSVHLAKGR